MRERAGESRSARAVWTCPRAHATPGRRPTPRRGTRRRSRGREDQPRPRSLPRSSPPASPAMPSDAASPAVVRTAAARWCRQVQWPRGPDLARSSPPRPTRGPRPLPRARQSTAADASGAATAPIRAMPSAVAILAGNRAGPGPSAQVAPLARARPSSRSPPLTTRKPSSASAVAELGSPLRVRPAASARPITRRPDAPSRRSAFVPRAAPRRGPGHTIRWGRSTLRPRVIRVAGVLHLRQEVHRPVTPLCCSLPLGRRGIAETGGAQATTGGRVKRNPRGTSAR